MGKHSGGHAFQEDAVAGDAMEGGFSYRRIRAQSQEMQSERGGCLGGMPCGPGRFLGTFPTSYTV